MGRATQVVVAVLLGVFALLGGLRAEDVRGQVVAVVTGLAAAFFLTVALFSR
jgi:hypothetical protein